MSKDERTYYILVTLGVIAVIVAMISSHISGKDRDGVTLPETEAVETVTEAETLVFEPIETEPETAAADTSEASPKMDENAAINADVQENLAETAYKTEDLIYLAKIVENEAGADYCTDAHQRAVASVVLNRVSDPRFPDTILGVITQGWNGECALQYAVGGWERFNALEPSDRAIENARYVLEHGATVDGAVWQAEFPQGNAILATFEYPEIYSTITYICE